jgi:hypothetical protein
MNVKNFIIAGVAGGIVDFLLGWLIYGIILKDTFPTEEGATENMLFIFLGCMSFGFLISYVFAQGEGVSKCVPGIKLATGIALFMTLSINFFQNMTKETIDIQLMVIDVVASMVLASFVGAVVAFTIGKLK